MEKLSEVSLWRLAVRGALHCRCYCVNDNEQADWPPLPSIPGILTCPALRSSSVQSSTAIDTEEVRRCVNHGFDGQDYKMCFPLPDFFSEGNAREQEILSVLTVPAEKMGRIIGRKGSSIFAEILIEGAKGPVEKVIIMGPVKQVRKAEAMLRGRMEEMFEDASEWAPSCHGIMLAVSM
ncbi:uncharacterized protein [Coffea arabica]|uniref:K Homology domain-containing protein n=1 Tax=Coffea arabica TaxID=13443 RepID=A0ABM4U6G7_COFAR